jgi:hypothetical protein
VCKSIASAVASQPGGFTEGPVVRCRTSVTRFARWGDATLDGAAWEAARVLLNVGRRVDRGLVVRRA